MKRARKSRKSAYIKALIADLEQDLPAVWGRTVEIAVHRRRHTQPVLAGGIDRLLGEIRARLPLKPGAEITLEANPGHSRPDALPGFREAGINRLSIGVQSFQPDLLAEHRPHS